MDTLVSQLTILVVDDEPLIRWSISETLGAAGHRVTEAEDAASALRALACMPPPDVVLLDLRLPDSNDLRLLEKIHTIAPAAMVIVMTASGTPEVTADAFRLGARGVLTKPFDIHDLERVVSSL